MFVSIQGDCVPIGEHVVGLERSFTPIARVVLRLVVKEAQKVVEVRPGGSVTLHHSENVCCFPNP